MLTEEMLRKEIIRLTEIIDTETGIWQELRTKADQMDETIQAMQTKRTRMSMLLEVM